MKILVPVKRVVDAYVRIRVKADNSGVETNQIKMSMNPFDEIALEEALRLKEADPAAGHEIIVVSIGVKAVQDVLRNGLALGADRAIFIETGTNIDEELVPLDIAKLLKSVVEKEGAELVIMGKQSIDGDNNQTGQMLAALLDWPQATFASHVLLKDATLEVIREVDGGLETLAMDLPAVVTTDLRLNTPRYASLPNIMKAKSKPLTGFVLDDFPCMADRKPHLEILTVTPPPERKGSLRKIDNAALLVDILRNEEHVIP